MPDSPFDSKIEYLELEGDIDEALNLEIFLDLVLRNHLFGSSAFFHGIVYVYDSNNPCTLDALSDWMYWFHSATCRLAKKYKSLSPKSSLSQKLIEVKKTLNSLPVILVANKCDKFLKKKQTKIQDLMNQSQVSSKFGEHVQEQFKLISKAFDFANHKNVLFLSAESSKADLELFFSFLEQISMSLTASLEDVGGRRFNWQILRVFARGPVCWITGLGS